MELPEQDHYEIARDAALGKLTADLDAARLRTLGARLLQDGAVIELPCLCWRLRVRPEPFRMRVLPQDSPVKIAWQILALNYLGAREPEPPTGFTAFADFAEGRSYQGAFQGRVCGRLGHTVGRDREEFLRAAERLGAAPTGGEPVRCIFRFFPLFELQVVRYEGDEDFSPSCNVLLSDNTLKVFSLEDGIVAAEKLVSALQGETPAEEPSEQQTSAEGG